MSGISKITALFILLLQLNILAQSTANYFWMNYGFDIPRGSQLDKVILEIDSEGNLINAGVIPLFYDYSYVHKISSEGELIWEINDEHKGRILDMVVDEKNNIFITGYYHNPPNGEDTLYVKKIISVNNIPQIDWEYLHLIGDDGHNINNRKFILAKEDSCIIVTGVILNRNTFANIVTIKLETSGNEIWKKDFSNNENYDVSPIDLSIDNNRDILILGNSVNDDSSTVQLVKYDSDGNLLWNKTITNPHNQNISAIALALNNSSPWISAVSNSKTFLNHYDSLGNIIKEIIRETTESCLGISIDKAQNIYQICNESIYKYNTTGNYLSSVSLPSISNVSYSSFDVDSDQNIFVIGKRTHFYTAKINQKLEVEAAFEVNWSNEQNFHIDHSSPIDIAVSPSFGVFISGSVHKYDSLNFNASAYQVTVKYSDLPTGIKGNNLKPNSITLAQNYPNPFNPTTVIKYQISNNVIPSSLSAFGVGVEGVNVQLKVYDVLGKQIVTLINKKQSSGNYEVEFDGKDLPSGVYFYRLQAGSFVETKKMVLLR